MTYAARLEGSTAPMDSIRGRESAGSSPHSNAGIQNHKADLAGPCTLEHAKCHAIVDGRQSEVFAVRKTNQTFVKSHDRFINLRNIRRLDTGRSRKRRRRGMRLNYVRGKLIPIPIHGFPTFRAH